MNTDTYLDLVRLSCPAPSEDQCHRFALRLAEDHSWYKHLPLEGPGEPFFLYLSPNIQRVYIPTSDGLGGKWRDIVRRADGGLTVDRQPGDEQPEDQAEDDYMTSHYFGPETTTEYVHEYGYWSYWNFGRPGEMREVAIAEASAKLAILDDRGGRVQVPTGVLGAGLVYLRGTISRSLSYEATTYEELRSRHNLTSHREDRRTQLNALLGALLRVRHLVFGSPMVAPEAVDQDWDGDDDCG